MTKTNKQQKHKAGGKVTIYHINTIAWLSVWVFGILALASLPPLGLFLKFTFWFWLGAVLSMSILVISSKEAREHVARNGD